MVLYKKSGGIMFKFPNSEQITYEEIEQEFLKCGFTKEDYEKTCEIENDKTALWIYASVAQHFNIKPYELLTTIFLGTISKHLNFNQ